MNESVNESTKYEIRMASLDDAPRIMALATQSGYPASETQMGCRLAELLQQANDAIYVAALLEGDVIAWMHLYVYRSLVDEPLVMVAGLVVDEDYQELGIGHALMEKAESWGLARGCNAIYLKSNIVRESAHEFYEGLGYHNVKTQYAFRKEL